MDFIMLDKMHLDHESQHLIDNFVNSLADDAIKNFIPDAFHTPQSRQGEVISQVSKWFKEFLDLMSKGCAHLSESLMQLFPAEYKDPAAFNISHNLLLHACLDNDTNVRHGLTIQNVCKVTDQQLKQLNEAAAHLFELHLYAKSSPAYALLSFLKCNEPAYWLDQRKL